MAPTCGAEPCAAVKATDGDDEEGMGAGAVLVQVGAFCCPVDVAELEDLGEHREVRPVATNPPQLSRNPRNPRDVTQVTAPHKVPGPSGR